MDDMMEKIQAVLNDEESMKQISQIAQALGSGDGGTSDGSSFSGSDSEKDKDGGLGDFDMAKLASLAAILSSSAKNDPNTDFLLALKPLLKDENQAKVDRLLKIFRLLAVWPAIKESGILGGDFLGIL